MEDVLEVYARPEDPKRPLVNVDETNVQLIGEVRPPLPPKPGEPETFDYEYVRNGTANLFMISEPLTGWRHVKVTQRRTAVDFAKVLREISDVRHPTAEKIVVVCDNLNTHGPACLYAAFAPEEARRLTERFEFHFTPKHGSWLNIAEIELSVLVRQCLNRRIPDRATLEREVAAWEQQRNASVKKVNWRFTAADSRIKLKRLYPSFDA